MTPATTLAASAAVEFSSALALAGTPAVGSLQIETHAKWPLLARVCLDVGVSVPLSHFKIRDLVHLAPGSLLCSQWAAASDVPLTVGQAHLSWAEFELVNNRLAVRITRLA